MDKHPGGLQVTRRLLGLAGLLAGERVLDLGAGGGESLSLLIEKGLKVVGIDQNPTGSLVIKGDMCALEYGQESFDAVLAECSFSVCGDLSAAISESARVLKNGGKLLVSDVCYFGERPETSVFPNAVTIECFKSQVKGQGFKTLYFEDISESLKTYYLESVWKGEDWTNQITAGSLETARLGYFMMVCLKEV